MSSPTAAADHPFAATSLTNRHTRARKRKADKAIIRYAAATLFPLSSGATWNYRSGTDLISVAVDGTPTVVKGLTTAKLVTTTTADGQTLGEATYTSGSTGVRLLQSSLVGVGSTDQETFTGGATVLTAIVRSGAKAAFKVKSQGVADAGDFAWTSTQSRRLDVLGMRTVTVAAGSFKAMLVRDTSVATQIQTNNGPLSVSVSTTTDAWYAPGVGLVRSVVTTRRVAYYNNVAVDSSTSKKITDLLSTNQTYQPPRPDLISQSRGDDTIDAVVNRRIKLESVVRNVGQEAARPSTLTLYLSTDRTVDFADAAVGAAAVNALAPGQSLVRQITLQLPRQPGTYYLATIADAASEVDELNRTNNWSDPVKIVVGKASRRS